MRLRGATFGGGTVAAITGGAHPARYEFTKEIIRPGKFIKDSEGRAFTITPLDIGHWVIQFRRMQDAGVGVPLPAMHRPAEWEASARAGRSDKNPLGDPRHNLGWVREMYAGPDGALYMRCDIYGDRARELAAASDVSICIADEFTDGAGNQYENAITHVALVTDPVIPGMSEFVPLSRAPQETAAMLEFLQKLGAALGIAPESLATEEAAQSAVLEAVAKLQAAASSDAPPANASQDDPDAPPASDAPPPEDRTQASRGSYPKLVVDTVVRGRRSQVDALVQSGHLTPAAAAKIVERYCSPKAVSLALSRNDDGGDFDAVLDTLKANGPTLAHRQQTPAQRMTLANGSAASDANALVEDAERRAKAFAAKHPR